MIWLGVRESFLRKKWGSSFKRSVGCSKGRDGEERGVRKVFLRGKIVKLGLGGSFRYDFF